MSGPLQRVLAAFDAGASTLDDIARRTGLRRDLVDMAVDQLRRTGHIEAAELTIGCPSGGCGTCASGHADGSSGCGSAPSLGRQGPVLVQLSRRKLNDQ